MILTLEFIVKIALWGQSIFLKIDQWNYLLPNSILAHCDGRCGQNLVVLINPGNEYTFHQKNYEEVNMLDIVKQVKDNMKNPSS